MVRVTAFVAPVAPHSRGDTLRTVSCCSRGRTAAATAMLAVGGRRRAPRSALDGDADDGELRAAAPLAHGWGWGCAWAASGTDDVGARGGPLQESDGDDDGGGGNGGGGGGGGGGGNGGNGSDDESREETLERFDKTENDLPADVRALSGDALAGYLRATASGPSRLLARIWRGWRLRVAADADFPFKVLMEETVGVGLSASGMIAARGKNIVNELDLAFCDVAVGGAMNFILVYLLTPTFGASGGALAQLPANLFSRGAFGLGQRVAGFAYKGALFAACGFMGSMLGTTTSRGLLLLRDVGEKRGGGGQEGGEGGESAKAMPNVLVNSAAWAGFMLVSSNPRYQGVAGVERVLFGSAPEAVAKLGSGALRTANNIMGGATWVWWAKAIGLQ